MAVPIHRAPAQLHPIAAEEHDRPGHPGSRRHELSVARGMALDLAVTPGRSTM